MTYFAPMDAFRKYHGNPNRGITDNGRAWPDLLLEGETNNRLAYGKRPMNLPEQERSN
jgi:hypothetical protein